MKQRLEMPRSLRISGPQELRVGAGVAMSCGAYLREAGMRRVLVIRSPKVAGTEPLMASWREAVAELVVLDEESPEPDTEAFRAVLAAAGKERYDAVIGLGGGSVLDVAKLVAVSHGREEPLEALFSGGPPRRQMTLIALPTTAGTGSEVSPNAILYDVSARAKRAVIGPALVPDAAFVDPELSYGLPPAVTAATGIDALSHCIEAYTNLHAHPLIDLYALEGIRLIARSLERAVTHGDDAQARWAMSVGSLYGGICLGPVNTAGVHALSYPLGSQFRLPHGLSNALLLPHVFRFNTPANPHRHAQVARALGVTCRGSDAAIAQRGYEHLMQLNANCGLPTGLAACGVRAADLPALAKAALGITRLLQNNPRPLSETDAIEIYQSAFHV